MGIFVLFNLFKEVPLYYLAQADLELPASKILESQVCCSRPNRKAAVGRRLVAPSKGCHCLHCLPARSASLSLSMPSICWVLLITVCFSNLLCEITPENDTWASACIWCREELEGKGDRFKSPFPSHRKRWQEGGWRMVAKVSFCITFHAFSAHNWSSQPHGRAFIAVSLEIQSAHYWLSLKWLLPGFLSFTSLHRCQTRLGQRPSLFWRLCVLRRRFWFHRIHIHVQLP